MDCVERTPAPGKTARSRLSCAQLIRATAILSIAALLNPTSLQAQAQQQPNIIMIMGDDIGWFNIGAYNQGIMSGGRRISTGWRPRACGSPTTTPRRAARRAAPTSSPAKSDPHWPDHGGPGRLHIGMPDEAPTIATVLKSMGYATGQFGKNHLGDLNQFLPTVHGFDEFFGYLYHLDAMEDPCHPNYPQPLKDTVGPRNMVHTWATERGRSDRCSRAGARSASRRSRTPASSVPNAMETVDDEILDIALKFIDKAKKDGKPFFLWLNPTRMHVVTHLSPKYEKMRTPENGWSIQEAGMAQLDDIVGSVMKNLKDNGPRRQHHHRLHHRQRRRELHLARRRPDAVRRRQGNGARRRLPRAGDHPLARQGAGRQGRERHRLRARLVPDIRGRGRQPEHRRGAASRASRSATGRTRFTSTATTRWT